MRVDLHLHSSASFDCRIPPLDVARRCRQVGLSPIFLTDHEGIAGAQSLLKAGETVVIGQEILTAEGELIGLFLKQAVPSRLSPERTVDAIKDQGGLVYLEHPYDTGRRNLREEAIERIAGQIDIVEIFNGRSQPEINRRAEELRRDHNANEVVRRAAELFYSECEYLCSTAGVDVIMCAVPPQIEELRDPDRRGQLPVGERPLNFHGICRLASC